MNKSGVDELTICNSNPASKDRYIFHAKEITITKIEKERKWVSYPESTRTCIHRDRDESLKNTALRDHKICVAQRCLRVILLPMQHHLQIRCASNTHRERVGTIPPLWQYLNLQVKEEYMG